MGSKHVPFTFRVGFLLSVCHLGSYLGTRTTAQGLSYPPLQQIRTTKTQSALYIAGHRLCCHISLAFNYCELSRIVTFFWDI